MANDDLESEGEEEGPRVMWMRSCGRDIASGGMKPEVVKGIERPSAAGQDVMTVEEERRLTVLAR